MMRGPLVAPGHAGRGAMLIYALGNIALVMPGVAAAFFLLPFYTDVALVPPAVASSALLVGKLWDVVNDPLLGWLSDRTTSRWGRRRVYLVYGTVPLMASIVLLWSLPAGLSTGAAVLWIALSYTVFDTCLTLVQMPYSALAAELDLDYGQRTTLMAYASGGALVGYALGAAVAPRIVAWRASPAEGYALLGLALALVSGLCLGLLAWRLREAPATASGPGAGTQVPALWLAVRCVLRSRAFVHLLAANALARAGLTLMQTALVYFVVYRLQMEAARMAGIMAAMLLAVALSIAPWRWACNRFGKHRAWAAGLALGALGCLGALLPSAQHTGWIWPVVALLGAGLGAHWVAPGALLPDVVDQLAVRHHERVPTGVLYGLFGLGDKLSRTLAAVSVGWVLQAAGYQANQAQPPLALQAIVGLAGPLPAVFLLLAALLLLNWRGPPLAPGVTNSAQSKP